MLEPAFFDTNLFLYAYSQAPEDRPKRDRARELFEQYRPVISVQVIQEFIAAALRKPQLGIHDGKIDEFLAICACHTIQPILPETQFPMARLIATPPIWFKGDPYALAATHPQP